MNKMFIDDIHTFQKKNKHFPAPTSYEPSKTFSKEGIHYSMRAKMIRYGERDENFSPNHLARQKKLPGPGFYKHPETLGELRVESHYFNHTQTKFPKAENRWRSPAQHEKSPAPDNYAPKFRLNENVLSGMPKNITTRFGRDMTDIHDSKW
jgi:hypothetical protein